MFYIKKIGVDNKSQFNGAEVYSTASREVNPMGICVCVISVLVF